MLKDDVTFIFVSYAREDYVQVTRLRADLAAQGISVWIDQEGIRPGTPDWEEVLRRAIRTSSGTILAASPHARSSRYVKDELRIAEMYQHPVYPVWIHGDRWMEAIPLGWGGTQFIDARGEHYPQALRTLVKELSIFKDTSHEQPETFTPLIALPHQPRNPYKGLQAFKAEDAGDFFGRDQFTHKLVDALQELLVAQKQEQLPPRLLAVIGPSGSGKSSVVMAGLIPQLQQGSLPESQKWIYLEPMVPGQHPLEALTISLSEHFPARSLTSIQEDLEDIRGLHKLAASLIQHKDTIVVLFIDQFEELFTQTSTEEERHHFLDLFITAITEPRGPVTALLTLRADFYDRPLHYLELGQLIEDHHMAIFPMTLQELREVIEKPARLPDVQLRFEDNLVGDLLFDVQGQVGALPLLQFTLAQLFEQRNGLQLTNHAYQKLGGVRGALAKHAESTYVSLPSEGHKRLARALFLRLIDAGTLDQDATKRRIALSELILSDPRETAALDAVWKTFTEKRLLTTSTNTDVPTIEVSHEALIRAWERLTKWLQEAHEDIYLHGIIRTDVTEWIRHEKNEERLYKGEQLTEAQAWRTRNIPSRDEDAFLQASIQQQKRDKQRMTRRTFLVSIAVLGLGGGSFYISRLLLPKETPSVQKLPYTYKGHRDLVESVSWSLDGKRIASASLDQTVQVWDASSGTLLLTYRGHRDLVYSVSWSPDGKRIASASYDQTVQVWDASSGMLLLTYRGQDAVYSVSWSPDGKRIASASYDQTVQVWDASSGALLQTYEGHGAYVLSVSWSPDGKRIASASKDQTVQVWKFSFTYALQVYKGHRNFVYSVSWAPDSKRIASGSEDETVQIWDASSGTLLLTYRGNEGSVQSVSWSPDGKRIAAGNYDPIVQIWDASSGKLLLTYEGHKGSVNSVSWSPDGRRIASGSGDETVQVWDASSGKLLLTYEGL